MKTSAKIAIVVVLAGLIVTVLALRQNRRAESPSATTSAAAPESIAPTTAPRQLPRLLDLGSVNCVPCRMMAPILKELETEYAGQMKVEFIDVWRNPDSGRHYGVRVIPTQIFYNAVGDEIYRHVGFFSKEEILAKWQEMGISLSASNVPTKGP